MPNFVLDNICLLVPLGNRLDGLTRLDGLLIITDSLSFKKLSMSSTVNPLHSIRLASLNIFGEKAFKYERSFINIPIHSSKA